MISSSRKKIFDIFAKYYEEYGIPGLCGWIDTIFLFEPQDPNGHQWTQRTMSKRLTEFFPSGKYPTSISSINRAIRINEKYGTVLKEGTHKSGYTYKATPDTEMIMKIFQGFIDKTNVCIKDMQRLQKNSPDSDLKLRTVLDEQIMGYQAYVQLLEYIMSFFEEEFTKMLPTDGD